MNAQALLVDQRTIRLTKRIGKGGEGEVYLIDGDSSHAVKLYTVSDASDREPKIEAMIRAGFAKRVAQVAFPLAIARNQNGRFAGFMMRLVPDHKALHELYPPGSRKHHFPHADYRFLVRTALNTAKAIASVHQLGCVIGDINHSSILVSRDATVALIDSDSFQVSENNTLFVCRVGVPEYTPPELQGMRLGTVSRTPNHDAFGLAVVVFQLLFMGRHPFIGTIRRGELPPLHDAIKDHRFAYTETRDVGMDQPPGTPALIDFPRPVAEAFEAAFGPKTTRNRPTAATWAAILSELERSLTQCTDDALHWYPVDGADCPWCAMEKTFGTTLFPPYIPPAQLTIHPFDPGAGGFNLTQIWHQIESFQKIDRSNLIPSIDAADIQTSGSARMVARSRNIRLGLRITAACTAIATFLYSPILWVVWLPLLLYGLFATSRATAPDTAGLIQKYSDADRRCGAALEAWFKKIGVDEVDDLLTSLRDAKVAYENLALEERAQREVLTLDRRNRQLHAFLDGFDIRRAGIRGIGPAKEAALSSYGVESAADIELGRVLCVPGFGPTISSTLVAWRQGLEAKFIYTEQPNALDRQALARISSAIQGKASAIRRTLLAGRANLEVLARRVKAMGAIKDSELYRLMVIREQIRREIVELGGTVQAPTVPQRTRGSPPASAWQSPVSVPHSNAPSSVSGSAKKSCPRCGSSMIVRRARRGRHAGHTFWGCTRYPVCKGIANI